jgi:hypothetical protein
LQLLLTLEPKIAFYMSRTNSANGIFDAPMARRLIKYTTEWPFDEQHWLLVSLTCSERGLAVLANEVEAKKVADYAEDLYARTPLARVEAGRLPWQCRTSQVGAEHRCQQRVL